MSTSFKLVSETLVDPSTIYLFKDRKDLPSPFNSLHSSTLLFINLESYYNAYYFKLFIEDIPTFKFMNIIPEISEVVIIRHIPLYSSQNSIPINTYNNIVSALVKFENYKDAEIVKGYLTHPFKDNYPVLNSKKEKLQIFWALNMLEFNKLINNKNINNNNLKSICKEYFNWNAVLFRGLPSQITTDQLKNYCANQLKGSNSDKNSVSNYLKHIVYVHNPVKIKSSLCSLVTVDSLDKAEKICLEIQKKASNINNDNAINTKSSSLIYKRIKANIHPMTIKCKLNDNKTFNCYDYNDEVNYKPLDNSSIKGVCLKDVLISEYYEKLKREINKTETVNLSNNNSKSKENTSNANIENANIKYIANNSSPKNIDKDICKNTSNKIDNSSNKVGFEEMFNINSKGSNINSSSNNINSKKIINNNSVLKNIKSLLKQSISNNNVSDDISKTNNKTEDNNINNKDIDNTNINIPDYKLIDLNYLKNDNDHNKLISSKIKDWKYTYQSYNELKSNYLNTLKKRMMHTTNSINNSDNYQASFKNICSNNYENDSIVVNIKEANTNKYSNTNISNQNEIKDNKKAKANNNYDNLKFLKQKHIPNLNEISNNIENKQSLIEESNSKITDDFKKEEQNKNLEEGEIFDRSKCNAKNSNKKYCDNSYKQENRKYYSANNYNSEYEFSNDNLNSSKCNKYDNYVKKPYSEYKDDKYSYLNRKHEKNTIYTYNKEDLNNIKYDNNNYDDNSFYKNDRYNYNIHKNYYKNSRSNSRTRYYSNSNNTKNKSPEYYRYSKYKNNNA